MEDDLTIREGESLEGWKARTGMSKASYYRYRGGFVGKRRVAFQRTKAVIAEVERIAKEAESLTFD